MEIIKIDELNEPVIYEVHFQFNDDESVNFAHVTNNENEDAKFSLTLKAENTLEPSVMFSDGKGNKFKLFMKKSL
jgi:hypothetical protein